MGKNTFLDTFHNTIITRKRPEQLVLWARLIRKKYTDLLVYVLCCMIAAVCVTSCSLPRIVVIDDPLSPEEHLNLGVTYENGGELDNALGEYKKASKKLPKAYAYMGNIFYKKGEFEHAELYYKKAIKHEPDFADAYNNLAWLYCLQKIHLDEAEDLVLKAIQLNPSRQDIYRDTLEKIREIKSFMK